MAPPDKIYGMSPLPTALDAQTVLRAFHPNLRAQLISLGNRGGFSGAEIWRVEGEFAPLCLKAWPEPGFAPKHLDRMHALMSRAPSSPDIRSRNPRKGQRPNLDQMQAAAFGI